MSNSTAEELPSWPRTLAIVAKYAHANGEHIQAATDKLERRYQHTG
ncbi:MAG: hypothetical protein ACOYL3_01070 [Desulfuromonadaceae bacterium]